MNYSPSQKFWLVLLRIAIGWHFLYEGLAKLVNANWSCVSYLLDSEGFLKNFFINTLAGNPDVLRIVDFMNIWGLILIGIALILGSFERIACLSGIVLLALYYLSHPPFVGLKYAVPSEGSYLVVNKILLELIALAVVYVFPTNREFGLDRFIFGPSKKQTLAKKN
ncbi:MAG TPA: DoxX family membrane protein [Bacteroidales bacterium]|nr:DoxX family membrane protein [Bacteroidales bacterium]HPT01547.1 DoxX family membrane protein [Bacteroidales bacterium]